MSADHVDVLIVGAGLSGIGAAVHLARKCPAKSCAMLEARDAIGGTWDLFRYPGVRSDSDMHTLGYAFKPWTSDTAIAPGEAILSYIREAAREHGVDRHIRFGTRMTSADWSSADACWHVETAGADGGAARLTCSFLFLCTGYYDYAEGHAPTWPGQPDFAGQIVHPQFWPEGLDPAGKRVIVIGSGATAVTLVPELAKTTAHVTMLQRSPTYIVSLPSVDPVARLLRRLLPARAAHSAIRWKNVTLQQFFYRLARRRPDATRRRLIALVAKAVGPEVDVARHFTPRYAPWDERLCLVPDADLFQAMRAGKAGIETDEIERFTESGICLKSGGHLAADIVVTATGLKVQVAGGARISVDGRRVAFGETLQYKGVMFSGVPNLANIFGYTNASWTLKADLTSDYICRLLRHMDARGARVATPVLRDPEAVGAAPLVDFTSGYIRRAEGHLPKQGRAAPWRLDQSYFRDLVTLRYRRIEDGVLELRS